MSSRSSDSPLPILVSSATADKVYWYLPPAADSSLVEGDFVRVPFGKRFVGGVVWSRGGDAPLSGDDPRLRRAERIDVPPMTFESRRFVEWMSAYTLSPRGAVLSLFMGCPGLSSGTPATSSSPRRKASSALADDDASDSGLDSSRFFSSSSLEVLESLTATACEGRFSVTLLEGETGSGKTEACLEAAWSAISDGGQALILAPEIALARSLSRRVSRRTGVVPIEWHSSVGRASRSRSWRLVASGVSALVVGARSALFLPFRRLRLIVVDEEHDAAYRQEDGVLYSARDMSAALGRLVGSPVILSSATPSLESLANVDRGRYRSLRLRGRPSGVSLPRVEAIDMREHRPESGSWLSPPLVEAIDATLSRGEQALLFLNRRGYAPLAVCRSCGHRRGCRDCRAWMAMHRGSSVSSDWLMCHHCGRVESLRRRCPGCGGSSDEIAGCGPGVERIAEEASRRWPSARVSSVSSDTGGMDSVRDRVSAIERGDVDIAAATQIISKGHNFLRLTLAAAVDADLGLEGGDDPRASERVFQLLRQVSGRAGRGSRPGRAMLQTYASDHPLIRCLVDGDFESFVSREKGLRRAAGLPPYGRLASVIVSSRRSDRAESASRRLARRVPRESGIRVLGPAPALLSPLRGRYRYRFLAKAGGDRRLQGFLRRWLGDEALRSRRLESGVEVRADVDPHRFF